MQINNRTSVIDEPQTAMDAGLKSLRIDRSDKETATKGRLRWLALSFAFVVLLAGGWLVYTRRNAATEVETMRVRAISTSTSGGKAGETILSATGYIVAAHKTELASKVSGRVAWIGVEKGDRVRQ